MTRREEEVLIVFVSTSGEEEAQRIGEALVQARHAACVTVLPGVLSMYWWEGALTKDREALLLAKTTSGQYQALEQMVKALHSYKVPEVLALRTSDGLPQYIEWVMSETSKR